MGLIKTKDGRPLDLGTPITELEITVGEEEDGFRLDELLKRYVTWRSRTRLKQRCSDGHVTINGVARKGGQRVREGDVVFADLGAVEHEVLHDRIELSILWEDDWLVAIDKAPGIVVHPVGRHLFNTVINVLHRRYRRDDPATDIVPKLCHRLDRETSGVLLASKCDAARATVSFQFVQRLVEKEYHAITHGRIAKDRFVVDAPIGLSDRGDNRMRREVRPDGDVAVTAFEVLARGPRHTLVSVRPHHGRTHQIRVHLDHIGHPIVGDPIYGDDVPDERGEHAMPRQALHNRRLRFFHVLADRFVELIAPFPADMARFAKTIGIPLAGVDAPPSEP